MTIPNYQQLLHPVLLLSSVKPITRRLAEAEMADLFNLTEEERTRLIPSGGCTYIAGRTGWAMTYLTKAKLIRKVEKATYAITPFGQEFLLRHPTEISKSDLEEVDGWEEAWNTKKTEVLHAQIEAENSSMDLQSPSEQIETAMDVLQQALKAELLETLKTVDPYFFEQIVIDVLVAMGYGGSKAEAAQVTQRSNDGGIDGIINEDRLGLDVIYVQAKRYQANIGRVEVQSFVGALAGHQANKGIFITTSNFNDNAIAYAKSVAQKLILINGERLAELMIEFNVGVSVVQTITVKRLDSDYFDS